ncbi:arginase family protein [bacterium]|nr:arginase family protein [bacterium]
MVGFLELPEWFGDELDPEQQFLVGGGDDSAMLIREASAQVQRYSARLNRDFNQFSCFDTQDVNEYVRILLGDTTLEFSLPVIYIGAGLVAPNSTRPLVDAYELGTVPPQQTVWYVGARGYNQMERDWARSHQRLLPGFEVPIDVALRTALAEIGGQPFHLMVNIDVVDPVWAPAVKHPVGLGLAPRELWDALEALKGAPIELLQICGIDHKHGTPLDTARLTAELARDIALLAWGQEGL